MALGLRPIASAPIGALLESDSRGVPEDIFGADLVHWYRDGWTGTEAVDLIDSANNMTAAAGRDPTAGAVNGHVTADFPGVDEVIACSDVSTIAGATEITIFGAFKLSAGQNPYGCIIGKLYGGVEIFVGANATGDRLIACVGANFDVDAATSDADPFDDTWHRFVYTWNNVTGGVLYLDGVAQTITEPAGQGAVPDASEFLSMGGATSDNSTAFDYFANGELANVGIAIREAVGAEITDLDDYLSDWLSSVNAYALTAAQASFSWTRNAANVRAQRRVTAAQAAFTHTGQAANLRAQRRIVAAQASFVETGQAANIRAQRRITAAQASFTWTGNAAGLAHGYALTAAQASYVWTRNAAGLSKASALVATQGTLTLAGQATNVRAQRRVTAAQASFALSGQTANVLAQRRLTAAQASFTVSGQASAFVRTIRMTAAQSTYTLSGQAANVRAQRRVTAAQASFAWTRNAAGLTAQRRLTAAQASFTETGQATGFSKQSRIVAALGSYSLTGQAAGLVYGSVGSYTLSAAHGSLTLTGQAALLRPARRLSAASAAYSLTGLASNLRPARRLSAAHAVFTLSGIASNLNGGRRISAGLALFVLTGQAATFARTRSLSAARAAFVLTLFDATLSATNLYVDWYELRARACRPLLRIVPACPAVNVTLRASNGTIVQTLDPSPSARVTVAAASSASLRPRVSRSLVRILEIQPVED